MVTGVFFHPLRITSFMKAKRDCVIFGGSFDPVHNGHLALAQAVMLQLQPDELRFLPCRISPHKLAQNYALDAATRLELLRLALADMPGFSLCDHEIAREGPSYSYLTLQHFRSCEPQTRFHWLLGADQWNNLHNWSNYHYLITNCAFIVAGRGGEVLQTRAGVERQLVEFYHPASATQIRQDKLHGRRNAWVPQSIAEKYYAL